MGGVKLSLVLGNVIEADKRKERRALLQRA